MLIPIGHENQQVTRLPWVTIALLAANVAVFLLTLPIAERQAADTRQRIQAVEQYFMEHPYLRLPAELARFFPAQPPPADLSTETVADEQAHLDRLWSEFQSAAMGSVYRTFGYVPADPHLGPLFTSMFMHGNWWHLITNMLFLWVAGVTLEDRWGRIFFSILYLVSGVVAALTHASMHSQSMIPLVGASGAIAGLMGAFLVRFTTTRIRFIYWLVIYTRTFYVPAYVYLPLWLLQQFAMARSGGAGGVAVWAHIGGFVFGTAVAVVIRLTDFEAKVLAPGIEKKTAWTASDRLAQALGKLDQGDTNGAITELEGLLKARPDNIEARATLITAYTLKEDRAAAGRESANLVGAYLKARDMDGALAAMVEHGHAYPDVPLAMRDMLALAAHREKHQQFEEAAGLYRDAIAVWPDDALTPKALVGFGRLQHQAFKESEAALELFERARTHPKVTPEFQKASEERIAGIRYEQRRAVQPAASAPSTAPAPSPDSNEKLSSPPAIEAQATEEVEQPAAAAPPLEIRLAPIPMRAVGIDTSGLHLQDRGGKTSHLVWQHVKGISVATIGGAPAPGEVPNHLILDLLMADKNPPVDGVIRCIRLSIQDLAIPQLRNEPSPLRGFQRFVATILKTTGGSAHPNREACLGVPGFPAFPSLAVYEADLLTHLPAPN
ncbi:MAG: rhomboid family intramembrane serine protease [Candidatus Methylomirabilota bacterium]